MDTVQTVVILIFAAAVGEGINEYFFLPWLDTFKDKWNEVVRVQVLRLWSGLVGIGIAWELQLCVFDLLGAELRHELVGFVLTGLLIGRGSNSIHQLIKKHIAVPPDFEVNYYQA